MLNVNFRPNTSVKELNIALTSFKKGTNTLLDDTRLAPEMSKESINLILEQDGLWKPRWGTAKYGNAISGESSILNATSFVKSDGTSELITVGGTTGKIFKSTDNGNTWAQVGTTTLSTTATPYFLQIADNLYITNGVDNLLRYDGATLLTYSQLSAPTGVTLTRGAGLTAGSYTYYYQITALNEIGETVGSAETSITVNKDRDTWVATSNEYIDISWSAVTGAVRYQIYFSDASGYENLLDSTPNTSYKDDGSATPNPYVFVPLDNTTTAPKFSHMELSGNRTWATKDPNNPYRVYFSGSGKYLSFFSAFFGGGWVDLEKGGKDKPIAVKHFRTGKGDSALTVFCSNPEGTGSIWHIGLDSVTVGSTSFVVPSALKILSGIGISSPTGAVYAQDNIYFANQKGVFILGSKPQLFNILSTSEFSVPIRPSYRSLKSYDKIFAYYYEGKVFFSVSRSSDNDTLIIYDTERNAWIYYWDLGVKTFLEYTDTSNNSHLLFVAPNKNYLVELSKNYASDEGSSIYTSYYSPLIPLSSDKRQFVRINDVIFEVGRPVGSITVEALGIEEKRGFSSVGTKSITDTVSTIDFANALWGEFAWSDDDDVPTTFSQATVKKRLKIRKKLSHIQFRVSSNMANADWTLLGIQAFGYVTSSRIPSSWN
jgi:hypothetical protein